MTEDRCFCGEAWNDPAEECLGGHAFGEADKLRAALREIDALASNTAYGTSIRTLAKIRRVVARVLEDKSTDSERSNG